MRPCFAAGSPAGLVSARLGEDCLLCGSCVSPHQHAPLLRVGRGRAYVTQRLAFLHPLSLFPGSSPPRAGPC